MFDKDEQLAFYYPSAPSEARDQRALDVLEHFPNSIMLAEKRPHSSVELAVKFKEQLTERKINESRFVVCMHSQLHPSRQVFLDQTLERLEFIEYVVINHYFPRDPTVDTICYDKETGGAMLDCGVYVFQ